MKQFEGQMSIFDFLEQPKIKHTIHKCVWCGYKLGECIGMCNPEHKNEWICWCCREERKNNIKCNMRLRMIYFGGEFTYQNGVNKIEVFKIMCVKCHKILRFKKAVDPNDYFCPNGCLKGEEKNV